MARGGTTLSLHRRKFGAQNLSTAQPRRRIVQVPPLLQRLEGEGARRAGEEETVEMSGYLWELVLILKT
jgi:hypothetical protein